MQVVFFCIILILIFFIGILFSKIKISLEKIELNNKNVNFQIKLGIFWFGFIKIFGAQLDEKGIRVLGKVFSYRQIFKLNLKEIIKKNLKKKDVEFIEKLKIKTDYVKFDLKIGIDDIFITTFLVVIASSLITELLKKTVKKFNGKRMNYKIFPDFNKNEIYFDGKLTVSITTICIICVLKDNNRKKEVSKI